MSKAFAEELLLKAIFGEKQDDERTMFKIIGGTPLSGDNLCASCSNGVHIMGYSLQEKVHCNYMDGPIHFRVRRCSKYHNVATPDLSEMKKIAWVIESRNRGSWGFNGELEREIVVRPPGKTGETPDTIQED